MTAISSPTPDFALGKPSLAPSIEGDRATAFAAAQRHSKRVRLLRWLVPAIAVFAVVAASAGWLASVMFGSNVDLGEISLNDGRITMAAPVLRGEDEEGRAYELRARQASQNVSATPVVVLRDLEGQIALDAEETATLVAPQARFDSRASTLVFEEGGVAIDLTSGSSAQLGVTQLDLELGTMQTDQAVTIISESVTLRADAMEGFDRGQRLLFTGNVRLVFTPDGEEQPQ